MAKARLFHFAKPACDVTVQPGDTVRRALDRAGVDYSSTPVQVRVNNTPADLDAEVGEGSVIQLSTNVKGGTIVLTCVGGEVAA